MQHYLELTNKIEPMVRLLKPILVSIQLRKKSKEILQSSTEVHIKVVNCDDGTEFSAVSIFDSSSENVSGKSTLTTSLQDNVMKTFSVTFSAPCSDKKLKLIVSPTTSNGSTLEAIESSPFSVVEHYLHVVTSLLPPYVFYKDVGGKDNGIMLTVYLKKSTGLSVDSDPLVTTRTITFRPSLRYEDGQLVPDQKILQSFTGAHSYIISSFGSTELKFRINEVSSKHRNERFCIAMEHYVSDGSSEPLDIAPGSTVGIEIRSKVNHHTMKRRIREYEEQMQELQEAKRPALEPYAPLVYPPVPQTAPTAPFVQPPTSSSTLAVAVSEDATGSMTSSNFLKVHNDFEELSRTADKVVRMAKAFGPFEAPLESALRNLEKS